jgi:2-hydroxychromene-2-carboxylate isomerase
VVDHLDFFFDPGCPWAWLTSRWVVAVQAERPALRVDWRFLALRFVHEERGDDAKHERDLDRRLEVLRVAAAVRDAHGNDAVGRFYTAIGTAWHVERRRDEFDDPATVIALLAGAGLDPELAGAGAVATHAGRDDLIRAETTTALDRTGGDTGTPVLTFGPPDGPSFFGPIISRAPSGAEALELWDAVVVLGANEDFSEFKRSVRHRPVIG